MDVISSIVGFFEGFPWDAALQVIGGLSIVAAATPTPLFNVILRVKELGAFNFSAARNADDR